MTVALLPFSRTAETASTSHPSQTTVSNADVLLMTSRAELIHSRLCKQPSKALEHGSCLPTFTHPCPSSSNHGPCTPPLSCIFALHAVPSTRVIPLPFHLLRPGSCLTSSIRSAQSPGGPSLSLHCPPLSLSSRVFPSALYCGYLGKPPSASPRGSLPSFLSSQPLQSMHTVGAQ